MLSLLWRPVRNTVLLDAATVQAFGFVTDPCFAPKSTNWRKEPERNLNRKIGSEPQLILSLISGQIEHLFLTLQLEKFSTNW